jgi:hypothetical protein
MLAYLLPYLELQMISDEIDLDMDVKSTPPTPVGYRSRVPWWSPRAPGTWAIAQAKVGHFLCPSTDAKADTPRTMRMMWPQAHFGIRMEFYGGPSSYDRLGRSNYLGTGGFLGEAAGGETLKGVFTNRSQTTFAQIRDGTSNTMMMGEAVGGFACISGKREYSLPWIGIGSMPTGGGLAKPRGCVGTGWWQFSSEHRDVVQFAFADGSVQSLPTNIDLKVYVLRSSKADGGVDTAKILGD